MTASIDITKLSANELVQHDLFFYKTRPSNINNIARGRSLTRLVSLARSVISINDRYNPICPTYNGYDGPEPDRATLIRARQWQLDNISKVKSLLAKAIVHKKHYYENHWLGKITRFILNLFNMWNNGDTAAICEAEDFLLFWDSRVPLCKQNGKYSYRWFFFLTPVSWIHENLDTSNFYNYTLSRTIECDSNVMPSNISLPAGFVRV